MDSSKYDSTTRKHVKRFQRSSGYAEMKKAHLAAREALEAKLRDRDEAIADRDEAIARLTKKLVEAGFSLDDVAKLAA